MVGQLDGKLHTYENVSGVFTELTGPANPFDGLNPGSFSSPSFVDIDGDGDMDAVMGNVNGTLRTFMNSAGVFTEATGAANRLLKKSWRRNGFPSSRFWTGGLGCPRDRDSGIQPDRCVTR